MKSYFGCSLRFFFEKVQRLPKPVSPALHIGKAVHEGLRAYNLAWWRGGDLSVEATLQAYQTAFAALEQTEGPIAWEDAEDRANHLATGERLLRAYAASEAAKPEGKPLGVEVALSEHLPGLDVPLVGVIDLVRTALVPTDFKTVGATPSDLELEAFLHEAQLVAYQILLEAATGERVTALELVYLVKTKQPKIIVHRVPAADETRKRRLVTLAQAFVAGVRAERFHPQPGVHCAWCAYRAECRVWKGGAA